MKEKRNKTQRRNDLLTFISGCQTLESTGDAAIFLEENIPN